MEDSYNLFSSVYRELIKTSGHLQNEEKLAISLLSKFNATPDSFILDGACGTGDLLFYLTQEGFGNIYGMDASKGMLDRAREILPDKILYHQRLENVDNWVHYKNKFDFILILSLSLLHIDSANINKTLQGLKNLLKPSGVLLFDNRNWVVSENQLTETDRPTDVYRFLADVTKADIQYSIFDKCSYQSARQIITYRIVEKYKPINMIELDVSYLMNLHTDYVKLLQAIGLVSGIYWGTENWPYQIIYAVKL